MLFSSGWTNFIWTSNDWMQLSAQHAQVMNILSPFPCSLYLFLKILSLFLYCNMCNIHESVILTHWGRVMHICVGNLTIINSDNGLLPGRRQAIIWTNAGILSIGPMGTNFGEISIAILIFLFKKMHLKVLSVKWQPFWLGLNGLNWRWYWLFQNYWAQPVCCWCTFEYCFAAPSFFI